MQAYFDDRNSPVTPQVLITNLLMALLGVGSLIVAQQVFTGWIALGDRANISRHDLNMLEWGIGIAAILLGLAALRTAWGIYTREPAGWAWTQWLALIALVVGFAIGTNTVLATVEKGSQNEINVPLFIVGAVIFIVFAAVYRYATQGADYTPEDYFRLQLADSPSAGAIVGFMVLFIGFSMATDLFLESTSIASVLTNNASKGIIAIGVTILMISGEFDLSVGSVVGATAMVYMTGMTEGFLGIIDPQPMLIAAIVALLYASLLGLINGLVFLTTGIPSFIVTLGTLFAYRAISLVAISGGRILRYRDYYSDFPQAYLPRWFFLLLAIGGLLVVGYIAYRILPDYWARTRSLWARRHNNGSFGTTTALIMGVASVLTTLLIIVVIVWLVAVGLYHLDHWGTTQQVGGFDIANGRFVFTLDQVTEPIRPLLDPIEDLTGISFHVNIPVTANFRMAIVWWILAVILFQIILMNTPYGNSVFAVGGNINAATAQGINAGRVKVQNFVLTAFLAGIAAVLETSRNPGVDPLFGNGWELEVIAMTVIGGALLTGGYGSIIGTMLGVLIFGMLQTGLVLVGMDSRMFGGVVGVIMVVAVVLNNVSKSQRGMNFSWISGMFRSITASR